MSRTIRVFWPQQTSGWKNFNWGGLIDKNSVVHISVSEGTTHQTLFGALDAIDRFRGEASTLLKTLPLMETKAAGEAWNSFYK